MRLLNRIKNAIIHRINRIKIAVFRSGLKARDFSIISQNCIGGVFYHDMGLTFQSPTVNLFIPQPDFIRFVNGLEHYLDAELEMRWAEEYPVGRLDDVEVHFVHYETCSEAAEAWARRKQRVRHDRIAVVATDRDGFSDEAFEQWKRIKYPKVLFTANRKYAADPDSVFFPEFEKDGCIPDIIPNRGFYRNGKLLDRVNSLK